MQLTFIIRVSCDSSGLLINREGPKIGNPAKAFATIILSSTLVTWLEFTSYLPSFLVDGAIAKEKTGPN